MYVVLMKCDTTVDHGTGSPIRRHHVVQSKQIFYFPADMSVRLIRGTSSGTGNATKIGLDKNTRNTIQQNWYTIVQMDRNCL